MNAIVRRVPSRSLIQSMYNPVGFMDEFESLARQMWESWEPVTYRTGMMTNLDMYEEKDELVIKVELPGVKKEETEIRLEEDVLTIQAEKKGEEHTEDTKFYARERWYGKTCRSIRLPFQVDGDKISAKLDEGQLHIRLPKAEEAKPKHIEIQAT